MHIGTVASGYFILNVLRIMKDFYVHLNYFDRHRLLAEIEQLLNLTHHENLESLVRYAMW